MAKPTPAQYVAQLQTATTAAEIEAIATALWDVLKIDEFQRTNKLTPYNKAVDAAFPAETLIDGVNAYHRTKADGTLWFRHLHHKFTNDKLQGAFTAYNNQRSNQLEASMDNPAVVDAEKFLACIDQCLNSDDAYEVSAGLIAASGRRAIEVWELGKFTKTADPFTVNFKGQAKRRDYDIPEAERLEYPIRLLIPSTRFLAAFRAFKKHQKYQQYKTTMTAYRAELKALKLTAEQFEIAVREKFHNIRGNSINRVIKDKTFGKAGVFENLDSIREGHRESSHILRHAAVNIVTYRDVQSNAIGKKLKFAAEQLGHFVSGEDSISAVLTSIGYINFEVTGNVPMATAEIEDAKSRAGNRQLRVNLEDRDKFNEIAAELKAPNQQTAFHRMVQQWGRVAELERELATLRQEKQTAPTEDVTKESEAMQPTLTAADVQAMIDNSMGQILEAVKGMATPAPIPAVALVVAPEPEPEPETPAADHNPALVTEDGTDYNRKRKMDKRGELAMTDINNAFWAVVDYNEKQLDDSKKWFISERLLKDLAGGSLGNIKRWMVDHETDVNEHNERNQLDKNHNRKHGRNGVKISDVVTFERLRPAGTYHHR